MNSKYDGELRLADGTLVRTVGPIDLKIDSMDIEHVKPLKNKLTELFERPVVNVQGTLTSHGIGVLMGLMERDTDREITCWISKQRYWELQYLAQGKRYPRPRKRKSKARMARKWREYEHTTFCES